MPLFDMSAPAVPNRRFYGQTERKFSRYYRRGGSTEDSAQKRCKAPERAKHAYALSRIAHRKISDTH